jgi:hypothetical protein
MATKAAVTPRKDPFAVVGDAMAAAADAMKKGTADARSAAAQAVPAVQSALAKGVYVATYYTAYGIVYSALSVGHLIPADSAFGYGMRDGAAAARDATSNSRPKPRSVTAAPSRRAAARKRRTTRRSRARTASRSAASAADAES